MALRRTGARIAAVYIDKGNTYEYIKRNSRQKALHYNYLVKRLLLSMSSKLAENFSVIMDIYHAKKLYRLELENYLRSQLGRSIVIVQRDSLGEPAIQVADVVANAIYKKLCGQPELYNVVRDNVLFLEKVY